MAAPRPSAKENPRSRAGHSPAIAQCNAAAARAATQPAPVPAAPGQDKLSFEQKRFAQDQAARAGR
jgi:hypothetical protein